MLNTVAWFAVAGAVVCAAYAFLTTWWDKYERVRDRTIPFVVAFLLLVLAAAAAAIDDKVADPLGTQIAAAAAQSPDVVAGKDLAAFSSIDEIHVGPLDASVCLTRFYGRDEPATGKWWTTCSLARSLKTVADVRRELAVKPEWGAYDESTSYTVPKGTLVTYVRGIAAAQCDAATKDCPYAGGGVQYLFPGELDPHGGGTHTCAAAPTPSESPDAAAYGSCQ